MYSRESLAMQQEVEVNQKEDSNVSPPILTCKVLHSKRLAVSFAGVEGADQEAEVREDQREEDGHTH